MYHHPEGQPDAYETLRLSRKEWDHILALLKSGMRMNDDYDDKREHARYVALDLMKIVIQVTDPGGCQASIVVHGYDISAKGIGLVHGRYLYPGSRCVCWLRHASKGVLPISGTLRWCRHVRGMVHMSGVELDEPVDIEQLAVAPIEAYEEQGAQANP